VPHLQGGMGYGVGLASEHFVVPMQVTLDLHESGSANARPSRKRARPRQVMCAMFRRLVSNLEEG
jgi:hypothetical protein